MKVIFLTQGQFTVVDDADYPELSRYKWMYGRNGYAIRHHTHSDGRKTMVYMHRQIMAPGLGQSVDHISGNKLDNRRVNLRVCEHHQNMRNMKPHKDRSSKYKGVTWQANCNKWKAQIWANGKQHYLGLFASEAAAAKAYDEASIRLHGQFGRRNKTGT